MTRALTLFASSLVLALACTPGRSEDQAVAEPEQPEPEQPEPQQPEQSQAQPPAQPQPTANLKWELSAEPTKLRMSELDRFVIRLAVTNEGDETVDPQRHLGEFRFDGESHMGLNLWFGNGARLKSWSALPPGETATDQRSPGEHLFEAPGTYELSFVYGDATTAVTVTVEP